MNRPSSELLDYVNCLDHCHSEMTSLVERLCNQNSGTHNLEGLLKVQEILLSESSVLNAKTDVYDIPPQSCVDDAGQLIVKPLGRLLHIVKRPEIRPRVLLCIHMDTVYGQESAFQTCRWDGEHRLNGPGVADAKGGLVVMLYALRALESSPLAGKVGWEVIINPDEEIGSVGSGEFLAQRAGQADWGLLFEPSLPDGTFVSTRKGTGNFEFVFRGRSAHSGREFEKGRNAIVACCKMMNDIWHLNGKTEATYNVGRISGGGALNIVPELAIGRVNVRVSSVEEQHEVERLLGQLVEDYNSQEGPMEGIAVEQYGKFTSPPKELTSQIEKLQRSVEECGRLLGIPVAWQATGGACDGNKFAAAGLPNIDTLGPQGGEIHSHSEYLLTDTLVPRAKLAALILMSLASE